MNWKYKHFYQERTYAAPRDVVLEAARTFMTGVSLDGRLQIHPKGFTAEGYSFAHQATAHLRVQPTAEGTKVSLDLFVSRAGATGFMLFDVGGYYNIQIRKWLDGIQWSIHQKLSPSQVGLSSATHACGEQRRCSVVQWLPGVHRRDVRSLFSDYGHQCGSRASFRKPASVWQRRHIGYARTRGEAHVCADFIVWGFSSLEDDAEAQTIIGL